MRLRLTREQRSRLFDHDAPRISGEGACPVEPGQTIRLSPKVSLRIVGVHWKPGQRWTLRYELHDRRDPPKLLRRTPAIHDEDYETIRQSFDRYGYPVPPTADVLRLAAQESAYTTAPSSLASAGEAIDEMTQRRYSAEVKAHDTRREQRRRRDWERKSLAERVAALESRTDFDMSRPLAAIRRVVAAAERKASGNPSGGVLE